MKKGKRSSDKEILSYVFSIISPGKPLREALDRIREAKLGALIVLGDPKDLSDVKAGGFELNTFYTPQKVYELSKMDGAIILSEDVKTIHGANIQLQPSPVVKTDESGTRHQAAHRIAKQKGNLVIAVSERRNKITLYKGNFRYILHNLSELLVKASQAIVALEKYSVAISKSGINLSILEFDDMVTLADVVDVVRKYGLLFRLSEELLEYIAELGTDGRLAAIQYEDIMLDQEEEFLELIKDYRTEKYRPEKIMENIKRLTKEELLKDENIVEILGYNLKDTSFDEVMKSRGYRLLSSISKITKKDVELLVSEFREIQALLLANSDTIFKIKGISRFKAEHIAKTLVRLKNKVMLDKV